jgi:hypothetical protein
MTLDRGHRRRPLTTKFALPVFLRFSKLEKPQDRAIAGERARPPANDRARIGINCVEAPHGYRPTLR